MTWNTEFTSPPSCQCARALVHFCQLHCWTWSSLACEELSKLLKFPGRIVSSHVLLEWNTWFIAVRLGDDDDKAGAVSHRWVHSLKIMWTWRRTKFSLLHTAGVLHHRAIKPALQDPQIKPFCFWAFLKSITHKIHRDTQITQAWHK